MTSPRTDALHLASLGWHLCPMVSGSKNPGSILGAGWQHQCSADPARINRWFAETPDANIGVLLGPKSGIIDVEYDSDDGKLIIEEYAAGLVTPTYRSAKSVHRLFKWEDRFALEGAKFGAFGTEWRFGQDSAQSVVPPSLHETGIHYQWLDGLGPDVPVASLPEAMFKLFLNLKQTSEKKQAQSPTNQVPRRYVEGDSMLGRARRHVEESFSWESILSGDGWTFARNRGDAQDWWRPGKTRGSVSGTVNFGGSRTLRVFTTSTALDADSSYDKFAYLCATKFSDDPIAAARGLAPEKILHPPGDSRPVDLSGILGEDRPNDFDDEEFCEGSVPESGLLREIYSYYIATSHRASHVMGLATAVSLCETLFGRRVASHTDLRTNDYNVIIAPTTSGKEACENAITKILMAADVNRMPLIPPDVQSGNGLVKAVAGVKCALWVCDEFGKTLESVLDRKSNTSHAKQIGTHLLKLYSKSSGMYGGAAHADGVRNQIVQPHLCLLGLTTGQMFDSIDSRQIQDGLFGRLAFWPVQNRPKRKTARAVDVPEPLTSVVRQWLHFEPTGFNPEFPTPRILEMCPESLIRWEAHADAIDLKMEHESESRAAIWGRVAARAMKLAIVHRCSRLSDDPLKADWLFVSIEQPDIDWGIRIANWLARIACGLIRENVVDLQAQRATATLQAAMTQTGEINRRDLLRAFRSISASEFQAAAEALQAQGRIQIVEEKTMGSKRVMYKRVATVG